MTKKLGFFDYFMRFFKTRMVICIVFHNKMADIPLLLLSCAWNPAF